jgi:ceramide glucosyltransferase
MTSRAPSGNPALHRSRSPNWQRRVAFDLRSAFAGAALLGTAAGVAYTAIAISRVRAFRKTLAETHTTFAPGITVLKPLHGGEPGLYANLRSLCDQTYPSFQIIFGAAGRDDPALEIARRLQREYPQRDIEIVSGVAKPANNPKIGNLLGMIGRAKHSLIAIADSDIHVGPGYLQAVASCFTDPNVGAATCIYGGTPNGSLPSALGAMFVNDQFSPSVLVALALEPLTYCFGATMAVRAELLERIGGLQALADHLGDDYMLGNLVTRAGYRVELCPYVVHTDVNERDIRSLWLHELRWARTIRAARPAGYAGSIVTYVLPLAIAFALLSPSAIAGMLVLALAATLRTLLHDEAQKTFAPHDRRTPWLIPVRDALSVGVWCASFLGQRVAWRGDRYRVNSDGRMVGSPGEL